jgi:ribonuclease III
VEPERFASLKELEGCLGHQFKEMKRLDQALTHKSFLHQNNGNDQSNEVLEFLGDAVLNLAVSHLLLDQFPEAQEGVLSVKRSHLVRRSSLAYFSKQLRLERYLLLGKSELLNGGTNKSSILANAYEAILGAIYLDSGFHQALRIVQEHLGSYIRSGAALPLSDNYKSVLQERCQHDYKLSPQYRVMRESGPDHDKCFQASVLIGGEVRGIGHGKTKKEAEQEAAKRALEELKPYCLDSNPPHAAG